MPRDTELAVVGTYGPADREGVHTLEVDPETGRMDHRDAVAAGPDPTFVAVGPDGDHVYAAVREDEGVIRSFEVDHETGSLTEGDAGPTGAVDPCHCSVDATGQYLFAVHYGAGVVSMLPIDDGAVGDPVAVIGHEGDSVDPDRQNAPHPHSATPGPENRFLYVPDLGTDQVVVYEMDLADGGLDRHGAVDVDPGSGPRHLAFHPSGDRVSLMNELASTVTVFDRGEDGLLTERTTVSTLPEGFTGDNKTAEVAVHPSGEYVYGSNRGHDTIAAFAVDGDELRPLGHTPTGGEWPRHFAVGPRGRTLYAENRDTDDIVAFRIDTDTGELTPAGESVSVPEPVCLQWVPRR